MKKILSVVGARPNYMKIAPLHRAFKKYNNEINHIICHTGQHYGQKMFKIFFEDIASGMPDVYELYQNYPNPFNPSTKIEFRLPEESNVSLRIYDITGQEVEVVLDNE